MKEYRGLAAFAGIAVGPALLYIPVEIQAEPERPSLEPVDAANELDRLQAAMAEADRQLGSIYEKSLTELGEEAAIFLAHQEFLSDPVLLEEVNRQIQEHHLRAEKAVETAFERYAQQLEMLEDDYYCARALDLRYVSHRAQRILAGMCGEMAGDLEAIPLLLGLGLDEFSMNAECPH